MVIGIRYVITDIFAFLVRYTLKNRLNYELYSEPCFPAPKLYLLSHTLKRSMLKVVSLSSPSWLLDALFSVIYMQVIH